MQILHSGFDTLSFALKGALEPKTITVLEAVKAQAAKEQNDVFTTINGLKVFVKSTGQKGGYGFILDTAPLGTVIILKNNVDRNQWNGFIKLRASALASHNWKDVFQAALDDIAKLGFVYTDHSFNRVDYCVDILTTGFDLNPAYFVAHSRSQQKVYYENTCEMGEHSPSIPNEVLKVYKNTPNEVLEVYKTTPHETLEVYKTTPRFYKIPPSNTYQKTSVSRGERVESVTIGKMPNRQVIVYDKVKQVNAKALNWWYKVWGMGKEEFYNDPSLRVIRVEIRSGKTHLTNNNIQTIDHVENYIKDVLLKSLKTIRYTTPSESDSNVSRAPLHPIWEMVVKQVKNEPLHSGVRVTQQEIDDSYLEQKGKMYMDQTIGNLAGLAACNDLPPEQALEQAIKNLERALLDRSSDADGRFWLSYKKSKDRLGM